MRWPQLQIPKRTGQKNIEVELEVEVKNKGGTKLWLQQMALEKESYNDNVSNIVTA